MNGPAELLDLAQAYSSLGRRVFPVRLSQGPDGSWDKRPLIKGYLGPSAFRSTRLKQMPWHDATHLGMALFPGEVALDFDVKAGKWGGVHLDILTDAMGPLPSTVGQTTMSGGWHLLFSGELPDRLVGRLALPDGSPADIDVVHAGHRYLVLYEPEKLLHEWGPFAVLPAAWNLALAKTSATRPTRITTEHGERGHAISELIDQVRSCEDLRNETLNRSVFIAVKTGLCTEEDLDAFRDAALHSGLPEDEVERTLSSATTGALKAWEEPAAWYWKVREELRNSGRRNRSTLVDAAAVIARTAAWVGKSCVGMSARTLSEEIGVSSKTAALLLTELCRGGWLKRLYVGRHDAMRYELVPPGDARGDSQPLVLQGRLSPLDADDRARLGLRKQSAFQRLGKGAVLPPGVLAVAVALMSGVSRQRDLVAETGCSRSTVARALKILTSVGVIDVKYGVVMLREDDVPAAMEEWALSMGVDGRPEFRAALHDLQRQRFAGKSPNLDDAVLKVVSARAARASKQVAVPAGPS